MTANNQRRVHPAYMHFSDLGLSEDLLRAVDDAGYSEPTPIQAEAIPYVLMARDILGCAQTGTGKTASFTLPMIDILAQGRAKARMPRSLILEPTRELAAQVAENFDIYGKYHRLNKALLIGGQSLDDQAKLLNKGVDVLIATPGRLIDMFERGFLLLNDVKILVIDESDRMLHMGFIPDFERSVGLVPPFRTTLLFSATMPPEIKKLAEKFLMNPKEISVSPPSTTADTITQGLLVLKHPPTKRPGADQKMKREALRDLMRQENPRNALIFCNRKRDVDVVYRSLNRHGFEAARLHGDMAQPVRMETLAKFKTDEVRFLVCSDVAARGLDIPAMSHVFNFDVPTHAEDYVHRIGRTGRAGREGHAFTIALPEDSKYVAAIERLTKVPIPRIELDGGTGGGELAEVEERPKRRRRGGRGGDKRGKPEAAAAPEAAAEETGAAPKPARERRPEKKSEPRTAKNSEPRERPEPAGEVKGLGDHMPAFLTREVKISGKSS
ncbi:MAG: DEAD/DEAH box helicase [Magnetovibrio sp.]|nr:DEAD/DEAH box helicase [Magnetovibrio sp.]